MWCAGAGLVATPILGSGQGLDSKNLLKNRRKRPSGENGAHGPLRRHSATAAGWLILMCLLLPGAAFAQAPAVSGIGPSAGPTSGGTTVTITGTNLTGATVVDFGATAATGVTVNSATSITATAPAHAAGTVDVTVTTAGGTSAVSGNDQYTYVTPVVAGPVSATVAYDSSGNGITLNLSGGAPTSVAVATAAAHGTATAPGTTISCTPTTGFLGTDSFTYTATNGAGTSAPATVSISVSAPTIAVSPATLPAGTVGSAYSQSLTASGGQAPYSFTLASGSLRPA